MIDSILSEKKAEFEKVIEHLHGELATIRTGRAHPNLLATVQVESYGSRMPLMQLAQVMASDAKTLTITPWDKSQIPAIEKAILAANLGFTPSNDGIVLRITLPALNEERRKEMVKFIGQIAEQGRIGIRQVREEVIKLFKKAEADGGVGKDQVVAAQKKLQTMIDGYNDVIKQTVADKEKEIMTV